MRGTVAALIIPVWEHCRNSPDISKLSRPPFKHKNRSSPTTYTVDQHHEGAQTVRTVWLDPCKAGVTFWGNRRNGKLNPGGESLPASIQVEREVATVRGGTPPFSLPYPVYATLARVALSTSLTNGPDFVNIFCWRRIKNDPTSRAYRPN